MPEPARLRGLLEWALAAFHAGFLLTALVALVYATGNLGAILGGLSTLVGLGVFGLLWFTTWWTTRRATRGVDWAALERPAALAGQLWRVGLWGGLNGVLFVLALLAFIGVNALALILAERASAADSLSVLVFGGGIALAVAFVAGAVIGVLFALLDGTFLVVARWLAPTE